MNKVKHIGTYIDNSNTGDIDCNVKISLFNGYVNKLRANLGNLKPSMNLIY